MTRVVLWIIAAVVLILLGAWLALRAPDIPVATLRARYASPASRFVEVSPGLVVHIRDEGRRDGLPLVLLHGSNASLHTWEPWVARLRTTTRIITYDAPAHGLTGPNPSGDYSNAAQAAVLDAVVRSLQVDRFVLGGNSMGGGVAARYAADHPAKVVGLILIDASGQPYDDPNSGSWLLRTISLPGVRNIVAELTPRWMIAGALDGAVSVKSILSPAAIDRYWQLLRYPGNRVATIERFAQGYSSVPSADLAKITAPTLILWGREDRFIPVTSAKYFSDCIRNSRSVIYDHVGHLPMEEAPDRSAADVRGFLDTLEPTAIRRVN